MKESSCHSVKFAAFMIVFSFTLFAISASVFAKDNPTAKKPLKLNYSWFAPTTEPHTEVAKYFISEIDKRTGGRVKITYYPGGSLVQGPQAYDSVMKGITDMDFVVLAYTPSRFPLTFAWNLPLGIQSTTNATRIMNETYQMFKPKELAGVKVLYIFGSSPCHLQTIKPVRNMAHFKGMKIRCTGIGAEYVKQLGGVPVAMPMSQTYEALQKGVVEGTINAEGALEDWKFGELIKHEYLWSTYVVAFVAVMNLDKWNAMPADIQKVFEEVSAECVPMEIEEWDANETRGREFAQKQGMQIYQPTPEMVQALEKARQPLYDQYLEDVNKKGLPGKAFLDELISLSKQYK